MDAAATVQSDIKNKRTTTTMLITGCPLLLQLHYFYRDNIDLGPLSKPHSEFPPVKDHDSETLINKMTSADTPPRISAQGEPSFGACGPRRREESCCMTIDPGQPSSSHVSRPETPRVQVTNQAPSILRPYNAHDFCEFLRERYPDMIDSELADHLKFHNARCILHSSIFKNSIIAENMKLAAKILDTRRQREQQAPARTRVLEDHLTASDSETETENKRARTHEKSCVNADIMEGKKICAQNEGDSFSMSKIWQWSDLKVRLPAGLDDCSEEPSLDEERWHRG